MEQPSICHLLLLVQIKDLKEMENGKKESVSIEILLMGKYSLTNRCFETLERSQAMDSYRSHSADVKA